ncbi:UNVERIFIED_CONTAM: Copia protein [Sesamum angustifolium]|uniref:Copia protein n=1 Tax=Sesamum angustifolium TaxID=2727405 RepID=A0AAW2LWA1_9LAMI
MQCCGGFKEQNLLGMLNPNMPSNLILGIGSFLNAAETVTGKIRTSSCAESSTEFAALGNGAKAVEANGAPVDQKSVLVNGTQTGKPNAVSTELLSSSLLKTSHSKLRRAARRRSATVPHVVPALHPAQRAAAVPRAQAAPFLRCSPRRSRRSAASPQPAGLPYSAAHGLSDYFSIIDLQTRRTIGTGHERGGLYFLDTTPHVDARALSASGSPLQWHSRLGHPSLPTLQKILPIDSAHLECESCELAPRVFGCVYFVHIHSPSLDKLSPRSVKCIFLGYSRTQKGYRCYDPQSRRSFTFADVTFFEFTPFYSPQSSVVVPPPSVPLLVPTLFVPPHTEPPIRLLQVYSRHNCSTNTTLIVPPDLPPTAAPGNPSATPANDLPIALWKSWKIAMDDEMSALISMGTWELVEVPPNADIVAYRWVFTLKFRADGTLERYKARLVAKGFTQTYGVDYFETFSPVARLNSIHVLFSLAVNLNWPMYQMNIKNAFLYGDLNETAYMEQPPGYVAQGEKQ